MMGKQLFKQKAPNDCVKDHVHQGPSEQTLDPKSKEFNWVKLTQSRNSKHAGHCAMPTHSCAEYDRNLGDRHGLCHPRCEVPLNHPARMVVEPKSKGHDCQLRSVYIHSYIHPSTHSPIHTYIPTYIHTYIHTLTHSHTHTHPGVNT